MHRIITDTVTLRACCERLAREPFITFDTEFLREKTYWPQLCLVQLAGAEEAVAVDPLAPGIDLQPLFDLLTNPQVLKVLHSGRQDMEIFYRLMNGRVPSPIFDTQIAAQVCGLGESVGYEALVARLLNEKLDKSQRFTDWSQRPLRQAQLDYALADVTFLREAYLKLRAQIEKRGRLHWLEEEMQELENPKLYEVDPRESWRRIKIRGAHPRQLGRLKLLAAWREELAQANDVPKSRIIRDETLAELAINLPEDVDTLRKVRGFPGHLKREWLADLMVVIAQAREMPKEEWPKLPKYTPLPEGAEGALELLKLLLRHRSREADVTPRMVAGKEDLEVLVRYGAKADIPLMHGWRYEIFGEKAMALLEGRILFRLDPKTGDIGIEESN